VVVDSRIQIQSTAISTLTLNVSTTDSDVNSVGSQVAGVSTVDSVIDSEVKSVGILVAAVDSRLQDTVGKGEFTAYIFTNATTPLADGGNDNTETGSYTTASGTFAILASLQVNVPGTLITKTVKDCEIDLGWTGVVSGGGTGSSKWATIQGTTAILTGSVDIPGTTVAETGTKATRWRSGQYVGGQMGTMPFMIMLAGESDGVNTLTCTGLLGTTIAVAYELS
jgi:hypothetical protein